MIRTLLATTFLSLAALQFTTANVSAQDQASTDSQDIIIQQWNIVKASKSRAALEGFKKKYGSDPVWGPLVDAELRKLGKSQQSEPSETKTEVTSNQDSENQPLYRDLQAELKRVGCYSGTVDGTWGDSSRLALARFAKRKGQPLHANAEALDALLVTDNGYCGTAAASQPAQRRVSTPSRRTVRPAPVASYRQCWICHTYDYSTQRVCVARGFGNPEQRIPPYIRCRLAGSRSLKITSP